MKDKLSGIRLFIRNVWMLPAADLPGRFIFSFSCPVFSLFTAEVMRSAFSRILIGLEGVRYMDRSNMTKVCTYPVTLLLVLLFLIIMTYSALFEIGGLLHAFSMTVNYATSFLSVLLGGGDATDAAVHIIRAMIVPSVNNAGITALFYQYFE